MYSQPRKKKPRKGKAKEKPVEEKNATECLSLNQETPASGPSSPCPQSRLDAMKKTPPWQGQGRENRKPLAC
jgi:hypothetical protein